MCVTNTTNRRGQPVSFNPSQLAGCPSALTQNLLGGYVSIPSQQPQLFNAVPSTKTTEVAVPAQKPRTKRRRKPQKPGKTAKNHDRHFVVHNYHDHALDHESDVESTQEDSTHRRRGGVSVPFPIKLHSVLDQVEADGLSHVLSWQPHGRCFVIHNPKEFVDHVMPKYFRQSKLTSFQRQLNLYGFQRLTRGPDAGGYYNELFLRGKAFLCKKMIRTKVKGTKFKAASSPENEPDFYSMPPVLVSPHHSEEEGSVGDNRHHIAVQRTSYEPLPVRYAALPQAQVPMQVPIQYYQPVQAPVQYAMPQVQDETSRVLDEAVDELFINSDDPDGLAEFAQSWDPTKEESFGMTLEDDTQLGYMLEKLLED